MRVFPVPSPCRSLLVLAVWLHLASAQRSVQKFNFLPVSSEKAWSVFIRGDYTSSPPCKPLYDSYIGALNNGPIGLVGHLIYNTSNCILDSATPLEQQTILASNVSLGLTPILLSTVGPTLTELALISFQRPVLAALLSLGTAAVFPTRTFSFYDDLPRDIIDRPGKTNKTLVRLLQRLPAGSRRLRAAHATVSLLQYLIAMAAVFNVMWTSWQLGTGSVFVLDCTASFYPVALVTMPLLIHGIVCGAFHLNAAMKRRKRQRKAVGQSDSGSYLTAKLPYFSRPYPALESEASSRDRSSSVHIGSGSGEPQWSWLLLHLVPSSAQPALPVEVFQEMSMLVELAHNLGTILGFAQVLYGVSVFSSLLFVASADAGVVLLRYLAFVIACRLMIALELGGMLVEANETESDGVETLRKAH